MDTLRALGHARDEGRTAVLVTVLAVEGEAPSHVGAKLAVADGVVLAGTLGCSEFDAAGVALAQEAMAEKTSVLRRRVVFGHGNERALELFAELHQPGPAVLVLGDTPVGRAVAAVALAAGRRVELLADATRLRERPPTRAEAVVLSDHDAPYVDEGLRLALASDAHFVGMLGSRRHAPEVAESLRTSGVSEADIARLHSPCGLDIGSRTPEEIGLSIVAEVVAAERGRPGGSMGMDHARR